jgi:hypothetical protein
MVAFDLVLEAVRERTRVLSLAIALDFLEAGEVANALKRALAYATRALTVMGLSSDGEAARRLADVRAIAESILTLAPSPSALAGDQSLGYEVTLFRMRLGTLQRALTRLRMRLGTLQRALTRLRTVFETDDDDVTTIAHTFALTAKALPRALKDAGQKIQFIIDALEAINPTARGDFSRPQLEAAQRAFRELASRRYLDAELFIHARNAVRDPLTRAMLANVALMITFAIDAGRRTVIAD